MRTDNAKEKRVELHMHSAMSEMDGVASAAELVEQAFGWGHGAVAITDSGSVCAYPEIMNAVRKIRENDGYIKPIYGMEANLVNNGDINGPVCRISILVKNTAGRKNLYKLVSLSNLNYFHKVPRIPMSELEKHREGLLIGSGYDFPEELCGFFDYYEICPGQSEAAVKNAAELAEKHGKLCVATGNVRYKDKEDEIVYKVLRSACGSKDADLPPMFFRTTGEMLDEFRYLGEEKAFEVVVTNTNKIAEMIDYIRPIPRGRFAPVLKGAEELITKSSGRAYELYGDEPPQLVADRMSCELRNIIKHDFEGVYLIAHKFVNYSEENGYHTGARGLVGSSFAAYLLGITDVNPLPPHYRCPKCRHSEFFTDGSVGSGYDLPKKSCPDCGADMTADGHDIPYEMLMGLYGDKEPDIDLNFAGEIQGDVHRYAEELFGKDHVFKAGMVSCVQKRTALGYVRNYSEQHGVSFDEAETERLAERCVGVKRGSSTHPGGLIVIPEKYEVSDFTPVQYPMGKGDGLPSTQFDFHALHDILTKFDILGHDVPTLYKRLEDMTGIKIPDVPMNDPQVYKLFTSPEPLGISDEDKALFKTGALGLPEFGTDFVTAMLTETQPKTFSELVKISALAHGTNAWIDNADELIKSGVCTLSDVIATRDDIFQYLTGKGVDRDLAYEITEITRKGGARRRFDEEIYQAFEEHDVPDWFVESCRKIMYLFPKAHAAAYVTSAVRLAWFKLYRPAEFYAAVLSKHIGDLETDTVKKGKEAVRARVEELRSKERTPREDTALDVLRLVFELMSRGIRVITPDDLTSKVKSCKVKDGDIILSM